MFRKKRVRGVGVSLRANAVELLEGRRLFSAVPVVADLAAAPVSVAYKELKNGLEQVTLKLSVTNDGPGTAKGTLGFDTVLLGESVSDALPFKPARAGLSLKDGKSKTFTLKGDIPYYLGAAYNLPSGSYEFTVALDETRMKSFDTTAINNTAVFSSNAFSLNNDTGTGSVTFSHFHRKTHIGAGGYAYETGTVKWYDGTSGTYQYIDEDGAVTLAVRPNNDAIAELYTDSFSFIFAAPKTLSGRSMTISSNPVKAVGTVDIPSEGIEPLSGGTYFVKLT